MKQYKKLILGVLVAALMLPAVGLVAVPQVEASCSYQGYYNSGGKCDKSFNKTKNIEKRLDQYGTGNELLVAYIERLLFILELLQQLEDVDRNDDDSDDPEIEVSTLRATNIDEDRAKLNGEIDFDDSDTAEVWFEYGKESSRLNKDTSKMNLDEDDDNDNFSRTISGLKDDTKYYFRAIGEDEDGEKDRGSIRSFVTDEDRGSDEDEEPDVTTDAAQDVEGDSVELNGSVDMNDFNNGRAFFVYGEDKNQVEDVSDDYDTYAEIDEDGDDFQKVLVDSDLDSSDDYRYDADNLDEDTKHYFSMCVEYEDLDNDDLISCGSVHDFTTVDTNDDEEPIVQTDSASDIASTTAELNGSVDMNDFNNGRVFFVLSANETKVSSVANDYDSYGDIPSDDDDLTKVNVDSDLDTTDSYSEEVVGLVEDTKYFYSTCVEFEDVDNDDKLICGSTEIFETIVVI